MIFSVHIYKNLIESVELKLQSDIQKQLAQTANEEKTKFVAVASHDLRQPIQAIRYLVNALQHEPLNASQKQMIDYIEESTDGISVLVDNLLDVSRLEANNIKPVIQHFSLKEIFDAVHKRFTPLAETKNLTLIADMNNLDSCIVKADRMLLEQVLSNLLSNAIKYSQKGTITLHASVQNKSVKISVTDEGIGIAQDKMPDIFRAFFQIDNTERNSKNGLGLGLTIVKKICQLQKWPLNIASEHKKGSLFSIEVSLGDPQEVLTLNLSPVIHSLKHKSILVIDDNEAVLAGINNMLLSWGCKVLCFSSLHKALSFMQKEEPSIDLIICDYCLSNGDNGLDAINEMRALHKKETPALIITGDTALKNIGEIEAANISLQYKPIKPHKLRIALNSLLM
jgi:CheY-like chemotaxis protein